MVAISLSLCHFYLLFKYYISWSLELQDLKKHPVENHGIKWQSDKKSQSVRNHQSRQAYYLQTECLTNLCHLDDFFLPWDTRCDERKIWFSSSLRLPRRLTSRPIFSQWMRPWYRSSWENHKSKKSAQKRKKLSFGFSLCFRIVYRDDTVQVLLAVPLVLCEVSSMGVKRFAQ